MLPPAWTYPLVCKQLRVGRADSGSEAGTGSRRATGRCVGRDRFMLVLSRKKNESIIINDNITIVVVEIRGDKVRLGVDAPKEIPVHRNEVYEAIRRSQQVSSDQPCEPDASSTAE